MKKKFRTILIIAIVALLLIAANITEIAVVFDATTSNATKYGEEWLEVIGGDLEKTIDDSKLSTLEFALEVQPFVDDHGKCEEIIRKKKEQMIEASNSICFNVYLATDGWYYIPDFKATEGYIIEKRSWYIGALKMNGKPYVTDPYVDAMTGNICFSVSVMLADGKSIACMDYTMENIQRHIRQMDTVNSQQAVIVTDDGIIAGCSDETLKRNFLENYTYRVRPEISRCKTKVCLWCGSKEKYALRSHKELKQYLKNYEEEIMPGYGHGEFLMKHTDECRKKIRDTIRAGISDRVRREN